MHIHIRLLQVCTALCGGAMVVLFLSQATIEIQKKEVPVFSIKFRNISYGYHTSANLCSGMTHMPNGATTGVEECDDNNAINTDACLSTCKNASCGDTYVHAGFEGCDDGNSSNLDACTNSCVTAVCGDGFKRSTEACDDGDAISGDGCSATCTVESGWSCSGSEPTSCSEVCGNGVKTSGEGCDDSNTTSNDGCSSACAVESGYSCTGSPSTCSTVCGDGILKGSEACDDGNAVNTDACTNSCISATCGDSIVQAGTETCDAGSETATCDGDCTAVTCGDQRTNTVAGEACDDGNSASTDACISCTASRCGDGFVRSGIEACEPPGVGTCSASCTTQTGVGGSVTLSITPETKSVAVKRKEPPSHCGNGVLETDKGEVCDLGKIRNRLSPECDAFCGSLRCGDGFVHPESEECEPERTEDGSFVVRTCGGKACTIPLCSEDGLCISGCRWAFLPLCRNVAELETPTVPQPIFVTSTSSADSNASFDESALGAPPVMVIPASSASFSAAGTSVSSERPVTSFSSLPPVPVLTDASSSADSVETSANGSPDSSRPASVQPDQVCGNSLLETGEECDEGDTNSDTEPDTCRVDCRYAFCGDSVVDKGEECDDGNDILGDGCTPLCTPATCGNNVLEAGEECDEGARNNDYLSDSCSTLCLLPRCGDGVVDPSFGEQCDSGENNSNTSEDSCRLNCLNARCGDGIVDSQEECDDGNIVDGDGCSARCSRPTCGNTIVEKGEICDDGNDVNGDGCSSLCARDRTTLLQWLRVLIRAPFGF